MLILELLQHVLYLINSPQGMSSSTYRKFPESYSLFCLLTRPVVFQLFHLLLKTATQKIEII